MGIWTTRLVMVLAAVGLTLFFLSPRLWIMAETMPGTFQWDRALQFQIQASNPLGADVEPALKWRLLPAWTAHFLGVEKQSIFIFPILGTLLLLLYIVARLEELRFDRRSCFGILLVISTSPAVLVPLHWWGMNDAWAWLALSAVVLSPSRTALAIACMLGPWIDERFLIALPLAWGCRWITRDAPTLKEWFLMLAGPTLYLAIRLAVMASGAVHDTSGEFVAQCLAMMKIWIPFTPLGWWMAWRASWILPLAALWLIRRRPIYLYVGILLFMATVAVMVPLAADLSRSAAVALPAVLAGAILFQRHYPERAPVCFMGLGTLALLIPTAHVSYYKIDIVSPLVIELFRLLVNP